jgi:non-ribosomal peptide synthetase component F
MLTAGERRRALVEWACTGPAERDERSVTTLFEQQVERTPDAVALECDGVRLTYHELALRSSAIADVLRAHGAGADSVVGISARRTSELVAGILGILRAGAAYVPLDPDYPRERVATMIAESGMRLALADERSSASLEGTGVTIVFFQPGTPGSSPAAGSSSSSSSAHAPERAGLDPAFPAESLAYVIFTSGSTGRPKGVAMTHRALRNLVAWQLRARRARR